MTSSPAPDERYPLEPAQLEPPQQSQGRVQRLSVEPVVPLRPSQRPSQPQSRANTAPRPLRAQDFSSDERDWDRSWPSQTGETEPEPPTASAQPTPPRPARPKLDPKHLTPEQELARQAAILGTLEAASAILASRLLLFVSITIGAVLAFQVRDNYSAGVLGAWLGVVLPIVALIDYFGRKRPGGL